MKVGEHPIVAVAKEDSPPSPINANASRYGSSLPSVSVFEKAKPLNPVEGRDREQQERQEPAETTHSYGSSPSLHSALHFIPCRPIPHHSMNHRCTTSRAEVLPSFMSWNIPPHHCEPHRGYSSSLRGVGAFRFGTRSLERCIRCEKPSR